METKYDFKIQTQEYEVIGSGPLITSPCQIGEWWVMPAQQYTGNVPADIQQKLFEFLSSGEEIQGLLIAEDMREVKQKPKAQIQLVRQETIETAVGTATAVVEGVFTVFGLLLRALLSFDPMIIAVLPTGEWICVASWYD